MTTMGFYDKNGKLSRKPPAWLLDHSLPIPRGNKSRGQADPQMAVCEKCGHEVPGVVCGNCGAKCIAGRWY